MVRRIAQMVGGLFVALIVLSIAFLVAMRAKYPPVLNARGFDTARFIRRTAVSTGGYFALIATRKAIERTMSATNRPPTI